MSKKMPEGGLAEHAKSSCIQTLQPAMPLALEVLYVRNVVSADLQPKVAMMVDDIKAGFAELLREPTWMDNVTISLVLRALFDPDSVLRVWWTNATTQAFVQPAQGFVDQCATFCVPEGCLNGELTLGENIADNGGIKAAYKVAINNQNTDTLSSIESAHQEFEVSLPGFPDLSAEQMFFLSAGHIWCGSYRTDVQQLRLFNNVSSPPKYRVNGPLSNMPEFAEAFNCPLGSNMNPAKKISVW
ncbi:hypothetical protein RvY_11949 [Ramazzottius varieornatus]|uniref:Peptidase M13 C-terminal domain-containing protein n=1 Tax=Ramazzottius varieornatus TaxID=947166 RepID=A0A1D1VHW1_RAMVA|nr:hypothetical protein RvY_11949 [Ramazzottius varieornatus]